MRYLCFFALLLCRSIALYAQIDADSLQKEMKDYYERFADNEQRNYEAFREKKIKNLLNYL